MESEEDWEEEEQLVVAELSGMINADLLARQGSCKIVDIDSEQPMLQVGRYLFAGEYEDAMGTCVAFEENQASSPLLKYKCHTMKKLMLQRTFLSERKADEPACDRIEVLALCDEQAHGRHSAICHNLDQTWSEKTLSDETKDCRDPDVSHDSPAETDECEDTPANAGNALTSAEEDTSGP